MIVRELVTGDGTVHLVARPATFWTDFDDPEHPVGATGLLVVGCGQLLRPSSTAERRRDCPVCAAATARPATRTA